MLKEPTEFIKSKDKEILNLREEIKFLTETCRKMAIEFHELREKYKVMWKRAVDAELNVKTGVE